jgi:hypothetical protein
MVRTPIGGAAELAEAAAARVGTPLPHLVQRAHRDEEEQRRPGPHDGGGQGGPVSAELHGRADQPEAQAELGREHQDHDGPPQVGREQVGRVRTGRVGMWSQRPPRLGEAGAEQHGGQQRNLHFADGGEHASAADHHRGVEAADLEDATEFHECGHGEVGDPALPGGSASRAVAKLRIDAELGEDSGA